MAGLIHRCAFVVALSMLAAACPPAGVARAAEEINERSSMSTDDALLDELLTAPTPSNADAGMPDQTAMAPIAVPTRLTLERGELRSVPVNSVSRVAIGNPEVVDVTIVSLNEVLLQAREYGNTNLILWDEGGQSTVEVEVIDPTTEAIAQQIRGVIQELGLTGVQVRREEDKIFLTGEVARQEDVDRLEQMLSAYGKKVTNLVALPPIPDAPPPAPPQTVQLTVQLVEMNRDDTDDLGVNWSDSVTFAETPFAALGAGASQAARLGEAFRWGALSRSGLSATLNMLIQRNKARILAEPKLVAASGSEAIATLGVEVPVITASTVSSGAVTQNIEFKQTGVELKFKPTVLEGADRPIQLQIDSKVSSVDTSRTITVEGNEVPGFKVRRAQTELVTNSGDAVIITGLLQDEERKNMSQLPGVGDIPVLGNLFRSTEFVRGLTELVIIVTPELRQDAGVGPEKNFAVEESLASSEVPGAVNDPVLRYALQIQERIAKAIRYPSRERALGTSGRVKIKLHLYRDGTMDKAMVTEPSGTEVLDQEALSAVENQAPFPPFPSDIVQQDMWLEIPVLFRP